MLLVVQEHDKAVVLVKVESEISIIKNNVRIRFLDFNHFASRHTRIEISGEYGDWSYHTTKRMGCVWIPLQKYYFQTDCASYAGPCLSLFFSLQTSIEYRISS